MAKGHSHVAQGSDSASKFRIVDSITSAFLAEPQRDPLVVS